MRISDWSSDVCSSDLAGVAGEVEPEIVVDFGERPAGVRDGAVMLGQSLECFPGQIDAVEQRIRAFEARERAQRMAIMIEAAVHRHRGFQRILPRMADGRMADIVRPAPGFGKILVESERARDAAADLRDLDTVGQANAIMVAVGRDETLRIVAPAAEGSTEERRG